MLNMHAKVANPVNLILSHIIVPPNILRPSVPVTPTLSNEDDLTNQIKMIVRANTEIKLKSIKGEDIYSLYSSWYKL